MTAYIAPGILAPEEIFARHFGTTISEMYTKSRKRNVVEARQVSMWYMITRQGYSESQAGHVFNRDHATAHHARYQVEALMTVDRKFCNRVQSAMLQIEKITEKMNNEPN